MFKWHTVPHAVLELTILNRSFDESDERFDQPRSLWMTCFSYWWCSHKNTAHSIVIDIARSVNHERLFFTTLIDLILECLLSH